MKHPDNTPVSIPDEVAERAEAAAIDWHQAMFVRRQRRIYAKRLGAKAEPDAMTDAEIIAANVKAKAIAEAEARAKEADAYAKARAKAIVAAERQAMEEFEGWRRRYLRLDELSAATGKATANDRNLNIVGASSSSSSSWAEGWVSRNTKSSASGWTAENWKADELTAEDWTDCFQWQ